MDWNEEPELKRDFGSVVVLYALSAAFKADERC